MKYITNVLCIGIICLVASGCATSKVGGRVGDATTIVNKDWVKGSLVEPVASGRRYNSRNALTLARVCSLVWETDRTNIEAVSKKWDVKYLLADLPDTDSQYLILGNRNYTVVSFRATQSKVGDIWTVLKFWAYQTTSRESIYTHIPEGNAGFRESAADCFASGLAKDLALFRAGTHAERAPLFITGHSLGAGVALLARPKLEAEGFRIDSAYLFGSPVAVSPYQSKGHAETTAAEYKASFGDTSFFHRYVGDNVPRLRLTNETYSPPGWSKQLAPDGTLSEYQQYRTKNLLTGGAWCVPWLTGLINNHNLRKSYIPALAKGEAAGRE